MKSKRSRPGEFSEPAWVAVSPSGLAERLVHQVGRGVGAGDRAAALEVDAASAGVARRDLARAAPSPGAREAR